MFYIAFMKLTSKSTPHPINKKPRLESIKLHSGYETDLIPQTKNPTNVRLNVVERINLFKQYHFLCLYEFTYLYGIKIYSC